ncbi:hypothetical protein NFI96_004944 [Prochilodus magdalenae]|nr:hypothetical protein NFI96_004944 [Prochilodus magdalenae]
MRTVLLIGILCAALVLPALADNKPIDFYHPLIKGLSEEAKKSLFENMTPEQTCVHFPALQAQIHVSFAVELVKSGMEDGGATLSSGTNNLMPLSNTKVADDGTSGHPLQEGQTMVDSLTKVVACYRHLASCIGSSTDSTSLRRELRQTRERAQTLALSCRNHLTARLRDKALSAEDRKEVELQWVAFSSCLELFHSDMCKVYHMGNSFSVAKNSAMVQTGMQGGSTEVAARALSMPDLQEQSGVQTASMEGLDQSQLEQEIAQVDHTLEDMEMKVNVLRWTVEARGPQYADPVSGDSASLALLSVDENASESFCDRSQMFVVLLLCGVAVIAVVLSVCVVFLA